MSLTRECFVPRPSSVYGFADYDTLELRSFAQICLDLPSIGFSDIAVALRAGLDCHVELAAETLGISSERAQARYKENDPEILNARQYAKIGNYGMLGGMGPDAFIEYAKGYGIVVSQEQAQNIHHAFRKRWRETPLYFRYCSDLCGDGDADQIVFPRSGLRRGRVRYTAVCNGFFQHLAACGAKAALYQVQKECWLPKIPVTRTDRESYTLWTKSPLFGCRPFYFGHDEIGMEIPYLQPERRHDAAKRLEVVMVKKMSEWIPDVPIAASVVMVPIWYKSAKPCYVDGLLVPSVPMMNSDGKLAWVPQGSV